MRVPPELSDENTTTKLFQQKLTFRVCSFSCYWSVHDICPYLRPWVYNSVNSSHCLYSVSVTTLKEELEVQSLKEFKTIWLIVSVKKHMKGDREKAKKLKLSMSMLSQCRGIGFYFIVSRSHSDTFQNNYIFYSLCSTTTFLRGGHLYPKLIFFSSKWL